jgi:hypothetical protein
MSRAVAAKSRGIILSLYTGESWRPSWYKDTSFFPLHELKANEIADYEILLEPDQKKWLFYAGDPIAGQTNLLFSSNHGLIRQNKEPITARFAYSLKVQPIPYNILSRREYAEATQLPSNINPRLNAWAKKQFAETHKDIKVFITYLRDYIHQQSFWYTLIPILTHQCKMLCPAYSIETNLQHIDYGHQSTPPST